MSLSLKEYTEIINKIESLKQREKKEEKTKDGNLEHSKSD
jgi:hypothetical protein